MQRNDNHQKSATISHKLYKNSVTSDYLGRLWIKFNLWYKQHRRQSQSGNLGKAQWTRTLLNNQGDLSFI